MRTGSSASDEDLVRECLEGRREAFTPLVDRYQAVIYTLAVRMIGDPSDAEDITQTVFLKAYEKLDRFDPTYKFFSWLYRMAMNESLNTLKRKSVRSAASLEENEPAATLPDPGPDGEMSEAVEAALLQLTPEDRAIILLKYYQGFSYDEVAFVFDIAPATVKSRLYTARQRLKDILVRSRALDRAGVKNHYVPPR